MVKARLPARGKLIRNLKPEADRTPKSAASASTDVITEAAFESRPAAAGFCAGHFEIIFRILATRFDTAANESAKCPAALSFSFLIGAAVRTGFLRAFGAG